MTKYSLNLEDMAPVKWLLPLLGSACLIHAAQVQFSLDLTWQRGAPDGVERDMIFVNDQFPGPTLVLDEGDEVTVCEYRPGNSEVADLSR